MINLIWWLFLSTRWDFSLQVMKTVCCSCLPCSQLFAWVENRVPRVEREGYSWYLWHSGEPHDDLEIPRIISHGFNWGMFDLLWTNISGTPFILTLSCMPYHNGPEWSCRYPRGASVWPHIWCVLIIFWCLYWTLPGHGKVIADLWIFSLVPAFKLSSWT